MTRTLRGTLVATASAVAILAGGTALAQPAPPSGAPGAVPSFAGDPG